MRTSIKGRELIKAAEGMQLHAYVCPAGKRTIGVGHVIKPGESFPDGLSVGDAEELLSKDLVHVEMAINGLIVEPLNQAQFDALASFVFNLGEGALSRSTLRKQINNGNNGAAAEEFKRWVMAEGKELPGLVRRRKAEAALFRMGNYDVALRIVRTGA